MFEINENAKVTAFKDINGRSAIIVDDFYKDPDEVRKLGKTLQVGDAAKLKGGFPGVRASLENHEVKEKLYDFFLELCTHKLWKPKVQKTKLLEDGSFRIPLPSKIRPFNLEDFNSNWDVQGFMLNHTNDVFLKKNPLNAVIPHQDYWESLPDGGHPLQFGSVIYLNTPDECAGGTNLYSWYGEMSIKADRLAEWKQSMSENYDILGPVLHSMSDEYKFLLLQDRSKAFKELKCEFKAEMKYNRMFLYQADVLHCIEIDLGMFADYNRINQVFFL
jgi:hypothetical protein